MAREGDQRTVAEEGEDPRLSLKSLVVRAFPATVRVERFCHPRQTFESVYVLAEARSTNTFLQEHPRFVRFIETPRRFEEEGADGGGGPRARDEGEREESPSHDCV